MSPGSKQPFPSFLPAGQAPMSGTGRTPNSLQRGVAVSSVDAVQGWRTGSTVSFVAAPGERVGVHPERPRDEDLEARTARGSTIRVITLFF